MRKLMIAIAVGAVALAGCVSVESTRAQLNSKNDAEVQKAENNIYTIATTGMDPLGLIKFESWQQVEYVQLTSNQELLLKIMDEGRGDDVRAAALQKIDFTKKGVAKSFVQQGKLGFLDSRLDSLRSRNIYNYSDDKEYKRMRSLKEQIVSQLSEEDLLDLIGKLGVFGAKNNQRISLGRENEGMLYGRLIATTESVELLWRMLNGDLEYDVDSCGKTYEAQLRLLSLLSKVTDAKMVEDLLEFRKRNSMDYLVEKSEDRSLLMKKLPEGKMIEMGMKDIKKADGIGALRSSLIISGCVKDSESKVTLLSSILDRISEFRDDYNRGWGWDNRHDDAVQKLFSALPVLTSDEMIKLLCHNDFTWKFLLDKVSVDCAYDIITQKTVNGDLELELIKKLPPQKLDIKVFAAVKSDSGKKAVMAAMPTELKKEAQEYAAKAAGAIIEKAKEFKKETFELQGFYLGMSFDDMKTVFSYHFPDWKIEEAIDGKGDEADHVIYIPGQRSPFCFASVKDKKVYQFNFGKKVLKKWYKYDVQNESEWARAYAREHRIDMKYVNLNKETTVNIPQADLSVQQYKAWLNQDTWQWKNNSKEYRLIYFGEPNVQTAWGDTIKEQAFYQFRYVRGDVASLRVKIERD